MKKFEITYYLMPDAPNIIMVVPAKTYEDACIFAKGYRREVFGCKEITK